MEIKILDWTGLDWTGLDWTGLDWTGLDWKALLVALYTGSRVTLTFAEYAANRG